MSSAYNRIALLATIALAVLGIAWVDAHPPGQAEAAGFFGQPATIPAHVPLQAVDADTTRSVQAKLASYGYTIAVDGWYGPQTTRVVKSWQRSNGLLEDGIAGPITLASLGLADRGEQTQVMDTLPPPARTVEQIIRDVWPDHLEDKAVTIAWRESRHQPDARNYCCLGIFQIYWTVHDDWLAGIGITSSGQLFDAETNARAALALYERAGGWGPWAQTNY